MKKEVISDYQGISIIVLFLLGTSSIMITAVEAGRDIWLAIGAAIIFSTFLALLFIRLHALFPGKNLFEICRICFGRFLGAILVLLFTWFAFHAGMLGLLETVFFIIITSLDRTPAIVVTIIIAILVTVTVKEGVEVIGRAAGHIVVYVIAFLILVTLGLLLQMDMDNLRPVLAAGFRPVFDGAFTAFTFPLGEIILLPMFLNIAKPVKSNVKMYLVGLYVGGIAIATFSTAALSVLGTEAAVIAKYPGYLAVSRIAVGQGLRGAEILMATILVAGSFVHICVFLLGACKGLAALTGRNDYRVFVVPTTLFMINLTYSWNERVLEYFAWEGNIWPYYAIPFQVLLPIVILIGAEIKHWRLENS